MSNLAIVICAVLVASAAHSYILPESVEKDEVQKEAVVITEESAASDAEARNLHLLPVNCSAEASSKCIQVGLQYQPGDLLGLGSLFKGNGTKLPEMNLNLPGIDAGLGNSTANTTKLVDSLEPYVDGFFEKKKDVVKLLIAKPGNQMQWISQTVKNGTQTHKDHRKKLIAAISRPIMSSTDDAKQ